MKKSWNKGIKAGAISFLMCLFIACAGLGICGGNDRVDRVRAQATEVNVSSDIGLLPGRIQKAGDIIIGSGSETEYVLAAAKKFASGQGTQADPYRITSREELMLLSLDESYWAENYYFMLMNDIDMNGVSNFKQIGYWGSDSTWDNSHAFYGHFNGNGFTISNLTVKEDDTKKTHAVFGLVYIGAVVENVTFDHINISGSNNVSNYYGAIGESYGLLRNVIVSNSKIERKTTEGNDWTYVGGLAGSLYTGAKAVNCLVYSTEIYAHVFRSNSTKDTTTASYAGGLIGRLGMENGGEASYVSNCQVYDCTVESKASVPIGEGENGRDGKLYAYAGGLVGCQEHGTNVANSIVTHSTMTSDVEGGKYDRLNRKRDWIWQDYWTDLIDNDFSLLIAKSAGIVAHQSDSDSIVQNCVSQSNAYRSDGRDFGSPATYNDQYRNLQMEVVTGDFVADAIVKEIKRYGQDNNYSVIKNTENCSGNVSNWDTSENSIYTPNPVKNLNILAFQIKKDGDEIPPVYGDLSVGEAYIPYGKVSFSIETEASYKLYERLSSENLTVIATFPGGCKEDVTDQAILYYDFSSVGNKQIIVCYGDQSVRKEVSVVTGERISSYWYETADGISLTRVYLDSSVDDESAYFVSPGSKIHFDATSISVTAGKATITSQRVVAISESAQNGETVKITVEGNDYTFTVKANEGANGKFAGGFGTQNRPYLISTSAQLKELEGEKGKDYRFAHFMLLNDIVFDLNETVNPLFTYQYSFMGTFDGNGHTLQNIQVAVSDYATYKDSNNRVFIGLFAAVASDQNIIGCIKNMSLIGRSTVKVDIQSDGEMSCIVVGGIAGILSGRASIENCSVVTENGSIGGEFICNREIGKNTEMYVGGIAGEIYGYADDDTNTARISRCTVKTNINAIVHLIEKSNNSEASLFATEAPITGNETKTNTYAYAGGIVGYSANYSVISDCLVDDCKITVKGVDDIGVASEGETNQAYLIIGNIIGRLNGPGTVEHCVAVRNSFYTDSQKFNTVNSYKGKIVGYSNNDSNGQPYELKGFVSGVYSDGNLLCIGNRKNNEGLQGRIISLSMVSDNYFDPTKWNERGVWACVENTGNGVSAEDLFVLKEGEREIGIETSDLIFRNEEAIVPYSEFQLNYSSKDSVFSDDKVLRTDKSPSKNGELEVIFSGYGSYTYQTRFLCHSYFNGVCSLCERFDPIAFVISGDTISRYKENKYYTELSLKGKNENGDGYVTAVGKDAFRNVLSLTSVEFGGEIKTIGEYAFNDCNALISIDLRGVTNIKNHAFESCYAMNTVIFGSDMQCVGECAFRGCVELTSINIQDVTEIQAYAFEGCTELTHVSGNFELKKIGERAFKSCRKLTRCDYSNHVNFDSSAFLDTLIVITQYNITGNSLESAENYKQFTHITFDQNCTITDIPEDAFKYCDKLVSVTFSDNIVEVHENAFFGCTGLISLTIGANTKDSVLSCKISDEQTLKNQLENVTWNKEIVSESVFSGAKKLKKMELGNNVTSIGNNAFKNCTNLNSVTIGNSVTSIGEYAFASTALTSIDTKNVTSIGNNAFEKCYALQEVIFGDSLQTIGTYAFCMEEPASNLGEPKNESQLSKVTLSSQITEIPAYAFCGCKQLMEINLENVTTIGEYAFRGCVSLTSIDTKNATSIGNYAFASTALTLIDTKNVTAIGKYAFENCTKLNSVTIGNSVTSIGDYAFASTALTSIDTNNVTSIGKNAFENCTKIGSVVLGSVTTAGENIFSGCSSIKTVELGDGVNDDSFKNLDFSDSKGTITSFTIGSGITTIPNNKFKEYSLLNRVTFGDSLQTIGEYAFASTALETLDTKNVTSIGNNAFENCTKIGSVVLGSVTQAGTNIFSGCSSIITVELGDGVNDDSFKNLDFSDSKGTITSFTIGSGITTIPKEKFNNFEKLTTFDLKNVTSIGEYAFASTALKTIDTKNVTSIGNNAFKNCTKLNSVTIGNSVTSIGEYAFASTALTSIDMKNVESIGSSIFAGCYNLESIKIGSSLTAKAIIEADQAGSYFGIKKENSSYQFAKYKVENNSTLFADDFGVLYQCLSDNDGNKIVVAVIDAPRNANLTNFNLVNYDNLVKIGAYAFAYNKTITGVSANHIRMIGDHAFDSCTGLTEITFTGTETDNELNNLEGVFSEKLPENNKEDDESEYIERYSQRISPYAFSGCINLGTVNLSNEHIQYIGAYAFADCPLSGTLTFSSKVEFISSYAFSGTTVKAGFEKIQVVGNDYEFNEKDGLQANGATLSEDEIADRQGTDYAYVYTSVNGVLYRMDKKGERNTYSLMVYPIESKNTSFVMPSSNNFKVTTILENTFAGAVNLQEVDVGNDVSYIAKGAFANTRLCRIIFGENVQFLTSGDYLYYNDAEIFDGCRTLQSVEVSEDNPYFYSSNGVLYSNPEAYKYVEKCINNHIEEDHNNGGVGDCETCKRLSAILNNYERFKDKTYLIKYPAAKITVDYTLPDFVTDIADKAFNYCSNLRGVIIENYVSYVGASAFSYCENLKYVWFKDIYAPIFNENNINLSNLHPSAFDTSLDSGDIVENPQTRIIYNNDYFGNENDSTKNGWSNYQECTSAWLLDKDNLLTRFISFEDALKKGILREDQKTEDYYAIIAVDNMGNRLTNIRVTLSSDINQMNDTSYTEIIQSKNGIATFYDYNNAYSFNIDFDAPYYLEVVDLNGEFYPYLNTQLYLDRETYITYVKLVKVPQVIGVSCNDVDISSRALEVNLATLNPDANDGGGEYIKIKLDFCHEQNFILQKILLKQGNIDVFTVEIKEDNKIYQLTDSTGKTLCTLTIDENGDCTIVQGEQNFYFFNGEDYGDEDITLLTKLRGAIGEKSGRTTSSLVFNVPYRLLTADEGITAKATFLQKNEDGTEATKSVSSDLNIILQSFEITEEDILLDGGDVEFDIGKGNSFLSTIMGMDSMSFNLGKNINFSTSIDGSEITLSLSGNYKKSSDKSKNTDFEKGYRENYQAHGKGSKFKQFKAKFNPELLDMSSLKDAVKSVLDGNLQIDSDTLNTFCTKLLTAENLSDIAMKVLENKDVKEVVQEKVSEAAKDVLDENTALTVANMLFKYFTAEKTTYTYNIRFVPDKQNPGTYYYRCYVYKGNYNNEITTFYGVVWDKTGKLLKTTYVYAIYQGHYQWAKNIYKTKIEEFNKETDENKKNALLKEGKNIEFFEKECMTSKDIQPFCLSPVSMPATQTKQSLQMSLEGTVVLNYANRQLNLVSGGIKGEIIYNFEYQSQFVVWMIPITIDAEINVDGKVTLHVIFDEQRKITVDEARAEVGLDVAVRAGIGCKALSAGVYGGVGTVFIFDFVDPNTKRFDPHINSWEIHGEVGVYAQVLWFKKEATLWKGQYYIIGDKDSANTANKDELSLGYGDLYNSIGFTVIGSNEIDERASLIFTNDRVYKVYYTSVKDKKGYDAYNFMKLAVSYLKEENGTYRWSEPELIDDNGYSDVAYSIYETENGFAVTYAEQSKKFNAVNVADIQEAATGLQIKMATFENGQNPVIETVCGVENGSENYRYFAQSTLVNGVPTVVWVENTANDLFGITTNGGENILHAAQFIGMEWVEVKELRGLASITDLTVSTDGTIAYIIDADGNLLDRVEKNDQVWYKFDKTLWTIKLSDMKSPEENSTDETPSATQITDRNGYVTSVKAYGEEIVYGYKKMSPIFISGKIASGENILASRIVIDDIEHVVWAENDAQAGTVLCYYQIDREGFCREVFSWKGLKRITDIAITGDGTIVYIADNDEIVDVIETDGTETTVYGKDVYWIQPDEKKPERLEKTWEEGEYAIGIQVNGNEISFETVNAEGLKNIISKEIPPEKESGLYHTKDEVAKFLDENEILSDQYIGLYEDGKLVAILFESSAVTRAGQKNIIGTAIYGVFRNDDQWGDPIEIVGMKTREKKDNDGNIYFIGCNVSSFNVTQNGNTIYLAISYIDGETGEFIGSEVYEYVMEAEIDVSYEIDYLTRGVTVIFKNNGAESGQVKLSVLGEKIDFSLISGQRKSYSFTTEDTTLTVETTIEGVEKTENISLETADLLSVVRKLEFGKASALHVYVKNKGNITAENVRLAVRVRGYEDYSVVTGIWEDKNATVYSLDRVESGRASECVIDILKLTGFNVNGMLEFAVKSDNEMGICPEDNTLFTTITDIMSPSTVDPDFFLLLTQQVSYDPEEQNNITIAYLAGDNVSEVRLTDEKDQEINFDTEKKDGYIFITITAETIKAHFDTDGEIIVYYGDGKLERIPLKVIKTYTVTWLDYIGNIIEITTVKEGKIPDDTTVKKSDKVEWKYFDHWNKCDENGVVENSRLVCAEANSTYQMSKISYTITWTIGNNSTRETIEGGAMPTYKVGEELIPPGYCFVGWDSDYDGVADKIEECNGDKEYQAIFELAGDYNGDERVDSADLAHLRRYLAGWQGYSVTVNNTTDLNKDGVVDGADVIIMRRYLAGWVNAL